MAAAAQRLSRLARVVISSEGPLPQALEAWRCPVPPEGMHHLLAFAGVCVAEGGTVSVEAGLLGTPAVTCNSYDFGYLEAMREAGLVRRADGLSQALDMAEAMLREEGLKDLWRRRAADLFASTDDVLQVLRQTVEQAVENWRAARV